MIITIQIDTDNSEDIKRATRMLHDLCEKTATDENDGLRLLNMLLLEEVETRTRNIIHTFMSNNVGVIETIYDLDRVVKGGNFRAKGVGPRVMDDLKGAISRLLGAA